MTSIVSSTDVQTFAQLANPQKTNVLELIEEADSGGLRINDAAALSDASSDLEAARSRVESNAGRAESPAARSQAESRFSNNNRHYDDEDAESRVAESRVAESRVAESRVAESRVAESRVAESRVAESRVADDDDDDARPSDSYGGTRGESASSRAQSRVEEPWTSSAPVQNAAESVVSEDDRGSAVSQRPKAFSRFVASGAAVADRSSHVASSRSLEQKQNILMDIERLKMQGIKFSKEWTVEDSVEDMQYEMRRHMLHIDEMNNINMMRDGLRMMCTGIEMLNGRFAILELNGWASEVCSDMNRYDSALGKLYRKYWRKSYSMTPEMEIVSGLVMSMGMHHFKRKLSTRMYSGMSAAAASSRGSAPAAPKRRSSGSPSPMCRTRTRRICLREEPRKPARCRRRGPRLDQSTMTIGPPQSSKKLRATARDALCRRGRRPRHADGAPPRRARESRRIS